MRVHITSSDVSDGDFKVLAETDNWYKVKQGFFSDVYWVKKTRCEVVRPIDEPEIKGITDELQILKAEGNA